MEDFGYTFDDLASMTRKQRQFLFLSKLERMKKEKEQLDEIEKERKKENGSRRRRGGFRVPRQPRRR